MRVDASGRRDRGESGVFAATALNRLVMASKLRGYATQTRRRSAKVRALKRTDLGNVFRLTLALTFINLSRAPFAWRSDHVARGASSMGITARVATSGRR